MRPKVKIAPIIAKKTEDNKATYYFKVINKSVIFQLVDVHFELIMLIPKSSPKGTNLDLERVTLKSNKIWFISRKKLFGGSNDYASYAVILYTDTDFDLVDKWEKGNGIFLDLKVIAKNNFSGITSVIHQRYNHPSCVKQGSFQHGKSLKIVSKQ